MSGAAIITIVLLVVIPVGVIVTGAVVAGILGWSLKETGDEDANPELIELS